MKETLKELAGEENLHSFEKTLKENNPKNSLKKFIEKNFLLGTVSSAAAAVVLTVTGTDNFYITPFLFAAFFAPVALDYFFQLYRFEKRKLRKEKLVPDVLLAASVFPKGISTAKIIAYVSESGFEPLSAEFRKASDEIGKGASVEEALENLKKRNESKVIARAMDLLVQGHSTGADMSQVFRESAEDMLETTSLLRERVATLLIEKYTLLFAGGFIVPVVLGLLVRMVSGMDFAGLEELGLGLNAAKRKELLGAALLGNQIYIAEYALIAAVFIALQENNLKKAFLYALFLLPASLIAYNLAKVV